MTAAFALPYPETPVPHPLLGPWPSRSMRRILIVEDDPDLETVLVRIVRSIDRALVVDWAVTAHEAELLLSRRSYCAVLADCMLEGKRSGAQLERVCERLQPRAPFALMSALPPPEKVGEVEGLRVPFLRKPFSTDTCRRFLAFLLAPARRAPPLRALVEFRDGIGDGTRGLRWTASCWWTTTRRSSDS